MRANDAIKLGIDTADMISTGYLGDLTDAEFLHRPCPGANHINWQVGHLLCSEHDMISGVSPGVMPPLPAGFAEKYKSENSGIDDPAKLANKEELMRVYKEQRAGTLKALAAATDTALAQPSAERFQTYAPTVASLFSLQGSHWLMHAGQWAVIRRQLGRKPLF